MVAGRALDILGARQRGVVPYILMERDNDQRQQTAHLILATLTFKGA